MREVGRLQPGDVCAAPAGQLRATLHHWPVPPEATRQCPPGESLGTALHHLPSQQTRGAPGTVQPGTGVRTLPCPPTRGVTGDSGNQAWPWGRRRSPVAPVRLRGAARGAAGRRAVRTPMLGPASSSLRLWGRLVPSDAESQGYPGASRGDLPNIRQLRPPLHSGLPVPSMYLAHFWMHRSPGSRRPGSRRWRRPGSQTARSPWPSRGPHAAGGAASRWTRRARRCSGRPLAPRAWGDRGDTQSGLHTERGWARGRRLLGCWPFLCGPCAQTLGFLGPSPLLGGRKETFD